MKSKFADLEFQNTCWKSRQNPTDGAKKPQGRLSPKIELIKIEERLYL